MTDTVCLLWSGSESVAAVMEGQLDMDGSEVRRTVACFVVSRTPDMHIEERAEVYLGDTDIISPYTMRLFGLTIISCIENNELDNMKYFNGQSVS